MSYKLILRPTWPEMHGNLSLCHLERGSRDLQGDCGQTILVCLFLTTVILHLKHHTTSASKLPLALLCSIMGIILSPIVLAMLLLCSIYRLVARATLYTMYSNYQGLMDGADAYWSLEVDSSKAVINILAFVELKSSGFTDLRCSLKKIFQDRLLSEVRLFKLKCLRKLSMFGYFYWEEMEEVCIDDHIRWMDLDIVTDDSVTDYLSKNCNNPLPHNNMSLWEVLVAKHPLTRDGRRLYPVLFRIHHAVGDGMALVSLFLNSFTDNCLSNRLEAIQEKQMNTIKQSTGPAKDLLQVPYTRRRRKSSIFHGDELNKLNKHCVYGVTTMLQKISVVLLAPYVLLVQACYGVDKNLLHGAELVGKKHVGWAFGNGTLTKVKFIKNRLNCYFTDVILLAISNVFEEYYSMYGKPPSELTVVIPARMPFEDEFNTSNAPTNRFTVGMIKLPIADPDKFQAVRRSADRLKTHPDYLVNYWLLKVICTYIPIVLLKSAMESRQATLAMSNIPGPNSLTKIDGNIIHDLVFLLPNRDTTGVGVSMLSYAGKLNFGLIVDSALIPYKEDATHIARRMVAEIDKIYYCVKDKCG
ncbi:O-acyltransferase WSD isoform X1 [Halyomorpha halys]|uniref:O-acyltransferase WSD isoform X1 n=3 Tax=Halyomorpha halys TaxID=286706 RepID=UPI0006D51C07|nr:uncharacterized protein LOC106678239 isoform X1 [Halyomorpha halys]